MSFPHSSDGTVHLLSKKSRRLHRDTFFFLPYLSGRLLGGLNQRLTPVTSAKLQCWVRTLDSGALDFELQPVTIIKTTAILAYQKEPTGPSIPPYSTAPLAPGDYAWYVTDTKPYSRPFLSVAAESTFAELKLGAENPGELEHLAEFLHGYHISSSLEQSVTTRDGGRCLITGSCSNDTEIGVSWIFPPAWVKWLIPPMYSENPSDISKPSNAMLMRKDLIDAFHDNAFGIDVDDDYRIVIFRDIGPVHDLLTTSNSQAYFRRPGSTVKLTGPDDCFFRAHFKHCLQVHLVHGDISEDYPSNVVLKAVEDLGLWNRDDEEVPFSDPRWNTELGKEILESHLLSQFIRDGYGYESPSEDDTE